MGTNGDPERGGRFVPDSPLEGTGFELVVPLSKRDSGSELAIRFPGRRHRLRPAVSGITLMRQQRTFLLAPVPAHRKIVNGVGRVTFPPFSCDAGVITWPRRSAQ